MSIVKQLVSALTKSGMTITTMESCTGGAIIDAITSVEGASNVTEGGYVTYSNAQKIRVGVSEDVINQYGVYSQECAVEMAKTVMRLMHATVAIGVTGTLSNVDPNNPDSRPGEVHYCIQYQGQSYVHTISVPIMERSLQKAYITQIVLKDTLRTLS